jgi:4-hydroxy-tetrahydrodipicolinate reductase
MKMSDLPGIVVTGASGRMGQMLVREITSSGTASGKARLVACLERPGHPWIGRDIGECMGGGALGVVVTDDVLEAFSRAQGVVDFTAPAATVEFAALAAQARLVHVIGTTGLEAEHLARIEAALDEDWDIEVVEAHHRMKVDAPSGTALMLGRAAAEGRGVSLEQAMVSGRDGITGARTRGTIGFSAIRGGDVVGEHDVIFAADGERVVLRHLATDRSIFARGALRAVLWGQGKKPGQYDMMDVLGL